jgi:hypothetical protein
VGDGNSHLVAASCLNISGVHDCSTEFPPYLPLQLNPTDVDIADIVDTVRNTRRLDFLVREIRQRMSCYALRASQVARTNRTTK